MPPVPNFNNPAHGQASKCPAHGRKRYSDVFADVRAVHRQVDVGSLLAFGDLQLFDKLQEHRELRDCASLAQQKSVPLGLSQFLAELADNVKFQLGVFREAVPQCSHRKPIRGDGRYGPGRVRIPAFCGQAEQVIGEQKRNHMFVAVACFPIGRNDARDDVKNHVSGIAFPVDNLALLKPDNRGYDGEATAFIIGQQVVHSSR